MVQRCAGVEPAGKSDADFLIDGEVLEDGGHVDSIPYLTKVADVVVGLNHPDVEPGVARNAEFFTRR